MEYHGAPHPSPDKDEKNFQRMNDTGGYPVLPPLITVFLCIKERRRADKAQPGQRRFRSPTA
jgi:hypothetical protein